MEKEEIEKTIKSLNASFAMSDMYITPEEEESARKILFGEKTVEDVISELDEKWNSPTLKEKILEGLNTPLNECLTEDEVDW